jgi:hypothetical protein
MLITTLVILLSGVNIAHGFYSTPTPLSLNKWATVSSCSSSSRCISRRTLPLQSSPLSPLRSSSGSDSSVTDLPASKSPAVGGYPQIKVLKEKLASTGRAGLLAYGLLNFAYYSIVTAVTWHFSMSKYPLAPGLDFSRRIQLTVAKLGSVAGIVWAGSQVTKIFRMSGAVVMAPVVDNLMAWCQTKFNLKSRNGAFWAIVAVLWTTLIIFYSALVVYGAAVSSIVVV